MKKIILIIIIYSFIGCKQEPREQIQIAPIESKKIDTVKSTSKNDTIPRLNNLKPLKVQ